MKKRAVIGLAVLALAAGMFVLESSLSRTSAAAAGSRAAPATASEPAVASPRSAAKPPVAVVPAAARSTAGPTEVVFASWGGKADQLGRERPQEGSPVGPMSFAVDGKGRLYLLDNVNGRIARRDADGRPIDSLPIDVGDAQDIALADDGSSAVLDRFSDKAVAVYDEQGKLRGKLPLVGDLIDDPGSVTGVFVDGSDVYAELEHAALIKIGGIDGAPAEPRVEIPGRPSRDGLSFLHAGIVEAAAGRVFVASNVRPSGEHRFTRELRLDAPVSTIVLLDTDKSGTIYFAASTLDENGSEIVSLTCLEPLTGAPTGSALMPANTLPEESMRDYAVLDAGGVIQALRTESGVSYARYDCN